MDILALLRLLNTYTSLSLFDALSLAEKIAALPVTQVPPTHDPEVVTAIRARQKINAIKRYRALTSCSLIEAKKAVESVAHLHAPDTYNPDGTYAW